MKWWQRFILDSWRTGAAALLILFAMLFVKDQAMRMDLISIAAMFGFAFAADAINKRNKKK